MRMQYLTYRSFTQPEEANKVISLVEIWKSGLHAKEIFNFDGNRFLFAKFRNSQIEYF